MSETPTSLLSLPNVSWAAEALKLVFAV